MKPSLLIAIIVVSAVAIASVIIGTIEYQSTYNYNCNSDGGYVTGFLSCTHVNEDFSDPRITGKMAREICSITGGECPPNYPANVLDDGSKMVGVTIWNAETNSEKSYVFTIVNDTLSYELNQSAFDLSKISSMRPNSMEFFYYPNPEDTENRDAFQKFILIRLPEELGGGADDVSAFRAYSALSVGEHCLIKYWPYEGRKRIEEPCWGSIYRSIDGLMTLAPKPVVNTTPVALPNLDLSVDENGSLYVEPPVWTKEKNGVIGIGRNISMDEIRQGSQVLVDSFAKHNPKYPPIPLNFAGLVLADIVPKNHSVKITYTDFKSGANTAMMEITKCACSELGQTHPYETLETFNGVTIATSAPPDNTSPYTFRFVKDKSEYHVEGNSPDLIKKSIVSLLTNYNVPITPEVGKTGTYELQKNEQTFEIKYDVQGSNIVEIIPDYNQMMLSIMMDSPYDGSLHITIPRKVIDATVGESDDDFFVLVDGMQVYFSEKSNETHRELAIEFDRGSKLIEIIGTNPDF